MKKRTLKKTPADSLYQALDRLVGILEMVGSANYSDEMIDLNASIAKSFFDDANAALQGFRKAKRKKRGKRA